MANARSLLADNEIYHVITRGNNRMKVFRGENDYLIYLSLLDRFKREHPVFLFNYCLMPNHVHLLLKLIRAEDLEKFMQGLSQAYSHHYRRTSDFTGHLWQGRYRRFRIEEDTYLLECGRYIEKNPVRAGLAANPQDWLWSSYAFYAFGHDNPRIDTNLLYPTLGETPKLQQIQYQAYVQPNRPYEAVLDKKFKIEE